MAFLDNTGLSYLWGKIKAYVSSAISGKEDSSNKVDSVDSTSTDDEYPSAKAVYDWISAEKGAVNGIAELDSNGLIPSDQLPPMTILSYGNSTWAEFLAAYQAHNIVYCRASSNSNPASGSQTRLAFMAYVDNATTPTNVEFQYYRSVSTHSDSQQGDQVYVYKLTNANTWTVTVRSTFTKVAAGSGLSGTWNNGVYTTKANLASETSLTNGATAAAEVAGRVYPVALDANGKLAVNVPWESVPVNQNKTFTGIIGSSGESVDPNDNILYFGEVSIDPSITNQGVVIWSLHYKLSFNKNQMDNYDSLRTDCDVYICAQRAAILTYKVFNSYTSSSPAISKHSFHMDTYHSSDPRHLIGFNLNDAYEYATAGYERDVTIEILEAKRCSFSFYNSLVAESSLDTTIYRSSALEELELKKGMQETGDDDTTNRLDSISEYLKVGTNGVYAKTLVMQKPDLTWESIVTTASSEDGKTANTNAFLPTTLRYYSGEYNYVADRFFPLSKKAEYDYTAIDYRYSFNGVQQSATGPGQTSLYRADIYLVGTLQNGLFYLDTTNWLATSLPVSDNGKAYIYVGYRPGDTYYGTFSVDHPIYTYKDGAFRPIIESITNKVTSISSSSTDIQYPTAKAVYDAIGEKSFGVLNVVSDIVIPYADIGSVPVYIANQTFFIAELSEGQYYLLQASENIEEGDAIVTEAGNADIYTIGGDFEKTVNKTNAVNSTSTDANYPTAKAVWDAIALKDEDYVHKDGDVMTGALVSNGTELPFNSAAGYQHIIHIVNTKTYSDSALVFRITDRKGSYYELVLWFENLNATTLSIARFNAVGENVKHAVAVCSSNVCDVYVEKAEANAAITIHEVYRSSRLSGLTITYPNEYYGATAPAGSSAEIVDLSRYVTIERNGEAAVILKNTSSGHQIQLTSAESGSAGIWDGTNSKWIFYSTSAGELHYTQGYVDNNGLVWWRLRNTNTTNPHEIDLGVNATGQAGLYDRTFEKYLIVSDKSGSVTMTTINNKVNTSSASEIGFTAKNTTANKQVELVVTSDGNAGVYDRTNSKYLIYSGSNGSCVIPQNLYHYGVNYEYFSGLTKGTLPSSTTATGLYISDKSGNTVAKQLANFKCEVNTSGTTSAQMRAYRFVADSTYWADLMVQIPTSSNPSVYFRYNVSGTQVNYQLAHMGGPNWSNTSLAHGMRVYKWGRMVMLTLENCKMTAAVSANTTILTLDAAYKPIYQVGFMSTSSKRFYIGTSGNVYCASALAKDETPRCSITYISAS